MKTLLLRRAFIGPLLWSFTLLPGRVYGAEQALPVGFRVSPEQAAPTGLTVSGQSLDLPATGGFRVLDGATHAAIAMPIGRATGQKGETAFEASSDEFRLRATFTPKNGRMDVQGEIESLRGQERGLVIEYRIPCWAAGTMYSSALDESHKMDGTSDYEENAYPLAAMSDGKSGVAIAIPPMQPRVFGITGNRDGLAIRFYLGLSPAPKAFPNRASFAFTIYAVDGREGFRSALARYYSFYPDYYTRRLKPDGLWMFQMGDRVPPNLDQYGFDEVEPHADTLPAAIARDTKAGIPMFPYTIVGQREIKSLPALPRTYVDAAKVLENWQPPTGQKLTKEDVSAEMAARLKDEIESSACTIPDGRYALVVRNTNWGGNSVTFKINPNPALFEGEGRATVGGDTLKLVRQWLGEQPKFAGVYVDSLGANWPATLNYRKDHFAWARFPLTMDPAGKVALHNDISHYEFLDALRTLLRSSDRYLFGNGIYAYRSRVPRAAKVEVQTFDNQLNEFADGGAPPEHWRPGARLGRFFDAALLDVAGSEAGVNANVARCQDARVFMGQKPYAFLNYQWEDATKVEELLNKSLSYAIFATSSRNFMTGVEYEHNEHGYYRDKKLIDWFVPLARTLSRAGWEPVRHAEITGRQVICERYGDGAKFYYAIYNDLATAQSCTIHLDAAALHLAAGDLQIREIARDSKLAVNADRATLELQPKKTYILEITGASR